MSSPVEAPTSPMSDSSGDVVKSPVERANSDNSPAAQQQSPLSEEYAVSEKGDSTPDATPASKQESNAESSDHEEHVSNKSDGSDSEIEISQKKPQPTAAELLGTSDEDDLSSENEAVERPAPQSDEEPEQIEEVEEEQPPPEPKSVQVEMPTVRYDLGKSLHYVKLPNFISIDARPFDPETYQEEQDEADIPDEDGNRRTKMRVENTIRWKFADENDPEAVLKDVKDRPKISNSRIVKWSDGSMSLHLGKEAFDCVAMQEKPNTNQLFVRQGNGLLGQAVFNTKLVLRPSSFSSMTHQKMTISMHEKMSKIQKVKVLATVLKNPEAEQQNLAKKDLESKRANAKRDSQQRRVRQRAYERGMGAEYLEDDGDGISLNAIKRKYGVGGSKHAARRTGGESFSQEDIEEALSSDTDEEQEKNEEPKPATPTKRTASMAHDSSSSGEDVMKASDDDDDDDTPPPSSRPSRTAANKRKKLLASSSEED